jgi:hypothetical protein
MFRELSKTSFNLWNPGNWNHADTRLLQLHTRLQRMVQTTLQHARVNPPQAYTCACFRDMQRQRTCIEVCALEKLVAKRNGHQFHEKLLMCYMLQTSN